MTPSPNQTNAPVRAEASVRSHNGQVKPQKKEVEADALRVLEHEDEQQAHSGKRGDGASPEATCLGLRAAVTGTLTHDHFPLCGELAPLALAR